VHRAVRATRRFVVCSRNYGHRSLEFFRLGVNALPLIVQGRTCGRRSPAAVRNPPQKADSEIFNKFGRSIESGRCTMRNHDFVSDGFLALIVAGLLLLCSILVVIALH